MARMMLAVAGTVLVLAVSYGLSGLHEPQSYWLWCTMGGLC